MYRKRRRVNKPREEQKIQLLNNFSAKTQGQKEYIRAIIENDIVFCVGYSGTGKSYCAISLAAQYLAQNRIKRVIISKPTIGTDEDYRGGGIGYLKGTLADKMEPVIYPVMEVFRQYFTKAQTEKFLHSEQIKIVPFDYIRGNTFDDSFVLIEEVQNCSFKQIMAAVTRIGTDSKIILTGDLKQSDRFGDDQDGLSQWLDIAESVRGMEVVEMQKEDIIRSGILGRLISELENRGIY